MDTNSSRTLIQTKLNNLSKLLTHVVDTNSSRTDNSRTLIQTKLNNLSKLLTHAVDTQEDSEEEDLEDEN